MGLAAKALSLHNDKISNLDEPSWLQEKRKQGLALYEELPLPPVPTRERSVPVFSPEELGDLKESFEPVLFQSEDERISFTTLEEALKEKPELIRSFLGEVVLARQNKWVALNQALWKGGAFLHVPKNVQVKSPVVLEHTLSGSSLWCPRTLVIAEPGSSLVLIEHRHAATPEKTLAVPVAEIVVRENAEVHYVQLQDCGKETHVLGTAKITAGRHARVTATSCLLGGRRTVNHLQVRLEGEGSQANLFGLTFGTGQEVFEHYTLQEHLAMQTESDLLFKVALKEEAYSHFDGLIWIEKGARKANAYQQNRNLLLSPRAKADTTPRLEILNDDVRCTHGATVGPVDEEQLFYLESRGLSSVQAEALIVEGFFEQVMERIKMERLREKLHEALLSRL